MKTNKLIYILSGAAVGTIGGFAIGYFTQKHKVDLARKNAEEQIEKGYAEAYGYYKNWAERKAQELAKDVLMRNAMRRAEREVKTGFQKASESPVEAHSDTQSPEEDTDTSDDSEAVEGDSEASTPFPNLEITQKLIDSGGDYNYKPDPGVMVNRNVFDDQPDPTQAVDYSQYANQKNAEQIVYGQKFLQDDRTSLGSTSTRFTRKKAENKDAIDIAEAEADLDAWYRGEEALDTEDDASVLTEDEQAVADAEADSEMAKNSDPYVFLDEWSYGRIPSYNQAFVIYCDIDGVWCDEEINKIEDPTVVFGPGWSSADAIFQAGARVSGDLDRVFIRNNRTKTDYELVNYHRSWDDMYYNANDPRG